jgi:hypothetical protein
MRLGFLVVLFLLLAYKFVYLLVADVKVHAGHGVVPEHTCLCTLTRWWPLWRETFL